MSTAIEVRNLTQEYPGEGKPLRVLDDISFSISKGESCAVVGPSGSGKTTLLGLCAGLDRPTRGSIVIDGVELNTLNEDQRAQLRNEKIGFVFQSFQLIPALTAIENVMVTAELRGESIPRQKAMEWLERVGLADRAHHYPSQLSGGEQQRVALARAFINQPQILFADEPTGSLDLETSEPVEALMFGLNRDMKTSLVVVTHNLELARRSQRIIQLRGGRLVSDERSTQV